MRLSSLCFFICPTVLSSVFPAAAIIGWGMREPKTRLNERALGRKHKLSAAMHEEAAEQRVMKAFYLITPLVFALTFSSCKRTESGEASSGRSTTDSSSVHAAEGQETNNSQGATGPSGSIATPDGSLSPTPGGQRPTPSLGAPGPVSKP